MTTIDYNQVLNAFIDCVPFNQISEEYKKPLPSDLYSKLDDRIAAVYRMIRVWQRDWDGTEKNEQKRAVIHEVEGVRDLIVRREEKELIDDEHINLLLSDILPDYQNGTYQRIIIERQQYVVSQMIQFLQEKKLPVPQILFDYL